MKKIFLTSCMIVALGLTGCNSSGSKNDSADSAKEAAANGMAEKEKTPERLPDTTFPSIDVIKYDIEEVEPTVSGQLESLDNLYAGSPSVMSFRNGPKRQGEFDGKFEQMPTKITVDWKYETATQVPSKAQSRWGGGTGWTGQPLYMKWDAALQEKLKKADVVNAEFNGNEVIFSSLCGRVYFLNPETGKPTREPVDVNNPIKGTSSIDPTLNGNMYVGQGISSVRPFGHLVVDLFSNKVNYTFPEDKKALRAWGAYDSSAIRVGQFLFRPAENGGLYKFIIEPGALKLHSVLRYKVNGEAPGLEASIAIYANYGYIADNAGNVICVNLDNLKPVWYYDIGDDTDASPMVVVEDGKPYVYVGCEIDRTKRGYANFTKLDAINGEIVWNIQVEGKRWDYDKKHFDGGFYASPLLGQGNCSDLIFTNVVKNLQGQNGAFIAIDRKSGKIVYEVPLKHYSWSSPVGSVTKSGDMVVFTCDGAGNVYIIDGKKGEILATERVGMNFESSPVLMDKSIYIGSRTNGLFRISFS